MQDERKQKSCRIILPSGQVREYAWGKVRLAAAAAAVVLLAAAGSAGYFYTQLHDYRANAQEFAEYRQHKEEDAVKLQQLLNDNEKMLRDMAEISNLEKKMRRALIRDVDSSRLSLDNTAETPVPATGYTGQGGPKEDMNMRSTMAVLEAQNKNIRRMLDERKKSVGGLLGEIEGRSGTMASFPDRWPVDGGVVSSGYGARTAPIEGGYDWHPGIDIAVDFGAPVYASGAGTVEQAGWNGGYGRYVRIDHGSGYESAYGHMSGLAVTAGQKVAKGEIIGFAGSTGYSTGPHVHYEVLADGENVDPYYMLKEK